MIETQEGLLSPPNSPLLKNVSDDESIQPSTVAQLRNFLGQKRLLPLPGLLTPQPSDSESEELDIPLKKRRCRNDRELARHLSTITPPPEPTNQTYPPATPYHTHPEPLVPATEIKNPPSPPLERLVSVIMRANSDGSCTNMPIPRPTATVFRSPEFAVTIAKEQIHNSEKDVSRETPKQEKIAKMTLPPLAPKFVSPSHPPRTIYISPDGTVLPTQIVFISTPPTPAQPARKRVYEWAVFRGGDRGYRPP
ncbi:hypothetical protein JTB14_022623 [Gonioctena quinquepunctata]|nr:hypothetical protein JTB14_022623 [Gonioctena quinquepunctata]